jgi:hypothetical protein
MKLYLFRWKVRSSSETALSLILLVLEALTPQLWKMAFQVQVDICVLPYYESESVVAEQRRFHMVFDTEPPTKMSIFEWYRLYL